MLVDFHAVSLYLFPLRIRPPVPQFTNLSCQLGSGANWIQGGLRFGIAGVLRELKGHSSAAIGKPQVVQSLGRCVSIDGRISYLRISVKVSWENRR